MQLEHLAIAVADGPAATDLFTRLLGAAPYKTEEVPSQGVRTIFFRTGQAQVELLEPLHAASPISAFLEKRGPGLHHVAFLVADLPAEIARLKAAGFTWLNETPTPGADGKVIAFLHPKSTGGVLIEFCQQATQP